MFHLLMKWNVVEDEVFVGGAGEGEGEGEGVKCCSPSQMNNKRIHLSSD